MSVKKRENAGFKYIKIKEGKFFLTTDKEHTDPYDEIEGQITGLVFKMETWENQEIEKLQIYLQDESGVEVLAFPVDSSWFSTFVNFASSTDLSKPISLHVIEKAEKDKMGKDIKKRSLLISQDGTYSKAFYTKANPNGLPSFKKIKVNGKEIWEKSDFLDFLKNVVENKLKPQLPGFKNGGKVVVREDIEDSESLPF